MGTARSPGPPQPARSPGARSPAGRARRDPRPRSASGLRSRPVGAGRGPARAGPQSPAETGARECSPVNHAPLAAALPRGFHTARSVVWAKKSQPASRGMSLFPSGVSQYAEGTVAASLRSRLGWLRLLLEFLAVSTLKSQDADVPDQGT